MKSSKSASAKGKSTSKSRDYSKYRFGGKLLNKRKLVLEVVRDFINKHPKVTVEQLDEKFHGLVRPAREATDKTRYFSGKDDVLRVGNTKVMVTNQMTKDAVDKFLSGIRSLGYNIRKAA